MRISDWSSDVCSSDLLGFSPTGAFFCPKRGLTGHDRGSTRVAREVNGPTRINREPNTLARIVAGGYPRRMSQVTAHKDAERADNVGFWVGVGAMTLIGGALYVAHRVLMHRFGDSWATLIVFVPAFLAVFVIVPVQRRVSYALRRRHCHQHGHTPRNLPGCASGYMCSMEK